MEEPQDISRGARGAAQRERLSGGVGRALASPALAHIVAILAVVLLALVSFLLWLEMTKRFPAVEPGGYFGSSEGVFPAGSSGASRLYVERQPGSEELYFIVMRPGWSPQVVTGTARSSEPAHGDWLLPITVTGPDGALSFIGSKVGPGEYAGGVTHLESRTDGEWRLHRLEAAPELASKDTADIRLWLALKRELAEVNEEIRGVEQRVPVQKAEIEKLTSFITERERLKSSADEKFQAVKEELKEAQRELKQNQDHARKLEAQLELAQRFTGMGRLVSLARESLEREGRWIDSMLRADIVSSQRDVDLAAVRAAAIVKIKREIAERRAAVAALKNPAPVEEVRQ